jgi:hypothetical protein
MNLGMTTPLEGDFAQLIGHAADPRSAEVLQAEAARVTALITDDHTSLDALLAKDLVYVHANALLEGKIDYLAKLREGRLKYKALHHTDQMVRLYGDVGIINGLTKVASLAHGQENHFTLRFTAIYCHRANCWQMIGWHSTRAN